MNEEQRRRLAELLGATLRTRFEGNKKAAYTKIGINPATFDRALAGLPIRDDRATRIINKLWPEAQGDLNHIEMVGGPSSGTFAITTPRRALTPREQRRRDSVRWLAQQPETYPERIVDWLQDLEERVEALEAADIARLSAVTDTTETSVKAAHDEVEPIERGQGHDDNA